MPLKECQNKHLYNGDKYGDTCPVCGLKQVKKKEYGKTREEIEAMLKIPEDRYVCAWLVCVEGINKGLSYPIHPGKNFIGGGDDMDIQILGDDRVDLYRHAVVAYDVEKKLATLLPGESVGLVYLENQAAYAPCSLEKLAKVSIGESRFLFVPFCDDDYSWSQGSKSE